MTIILDDKDLGEPTNPKIERNTEIASETIPQAWYNEETNKWYYNWEGAMQECAFLGKRMPTKDEWSLCNEKEMGNERGKLSQNLSISFNGYRHHDGMYINILSDAYYWSSTLDLTAKLDYFFNTYWAYNLFISGNLVNSFLSIYNNDRSKQSYGFSVRCIAN